MSLSVSQPHYDVGKVKTLVSTLKTFVAAHVLTHLCYVGRNMATNLLNFDLSRFLIVDKVNQRRVSLDLPALANLATASTELT